ncbi:hypothetical protein GGR51DRAFT_536656 [Nemania sp. FL0031]|nr:hypothetical protein GGR51DRAFT_536656 [Nemania sp. FL0031]
MTNCVEHDCHPRRAPGNLREARQFFGWYNVGDSLYYDLIDILEIRLESLLLLNCAQGIYSIFLGVIIQGVEDICGEAVSGQVLRWLHCAAREKHTVTIKYKESLQERS